MTRAGSGTVIALVSVIAASAVGCGSSSPELSCGSEPINSAVVSVVGESTLETFQVERLDECIWTSLSDPGNTITVRIEEVPDAELFVEHAIEATDSARVEMLDFADGAVLFLSLIHI